VQVVIMTHEAREEAVQQALDVIAKHEYVAKKTHVLRVLD
jgi:hypothetical protein